MSRPDRTGALRLRPLRDGDAPEVRAAHAELAADGFDFLLDERPGEPWPAYVRRLQRIRDGVDLDEGRVPATFLVAEAGGRLVGRVSVRHELNARLAERDGHIGYCVRPGDRRRGHATEILRQALLVARAVGVTRALVTCDEGNLASAATIEACGGRFERPAAGEGTAVRRYLLDT